LKKAATILLAILLLTNLSTSPTAFAWDPATSDLSGTNTSTDASVRRLDIDSTTAGLQIGEDGESMAFTIQLGPKLTGQGFKAVGMTAGDQYEIDFTIADENFAILFIATGSAEGIMKVLHKATGEPTWLNPETHSQPGIGSGTHYRSLSLNIGFTLTSSGTATNGLVKLVVAKALLYGLGGTETVVTGIFGATFENGDGTPGSGGVTPNDRCPSSEGVAFSLLQGIDDFPHGTLVLAIPVMGLYVLFSRKNRGGRR